MHPQPRASPQPKAATLRARAQHFPITVSALSLLPSMLHLAPPKPPGVSSLGQPRQPPAHLSAPALPWNPGEAGGSRRCSETSIRRQPLTQHARPGPSRFPLIR